MATAGETDVCSNAVNLETQLSHRGTLWRGLVLSHPAGEAAQQLELHTHTHIKAHTDTDVLFKA